MEYTNKLLRLYCNVNDITMVKNILDDGADIHNHNEYCLINSIKKNNYDMMIELIERGANYNNFENGYLLYLCVNYNNIKALKYFIEIKNIKNTIDLILLSIRKCNFLILKYLLTIKLQRFNINKDIYPRTASSNMDINIIKLLLKKGVNINISNDCIIKGFAKTNNINDIKFLVENGANIHVDNEFILMNNNNINIIKYLIENGSDIHINNEEILIKSCKMNNIELIKYLIKKGSFIYDKIQIMLKIVTRRKYQELFNYLIPFAFHKKIRTGHKYYNNIKFNNTDNESSLNLFNEYTNLKIELLEKINLHNY